MRIKTMLSAAVLTLSSAALASGIGGGQMMNNMATGNATMNDTMANDAMPMPDNASTPPMDNATPETATPDSGMDDAPPK